jgi:transposase
MAERVSRGRMERMFVRKKSNKSGSVSVHIVRKAGGKYRLVQAVGSSRDPQEVERLEREAHHRIPALLGQQSLGFATETDSIIHDFLHGDSLQVRVTGPERVLGALFDAMGFGVVPDALFRHIVIARLAYPVSKLKTVEYLRRSQGVHVEISAVYRFLDTLHSSYKTLVEATTYAHTRSVCGDSFAVVFYDMTTLYFDAADEDDLRKVGFSKDGKFQKPQIVLGLLVAPNGFPIGYDIFQGNTSEGQTLVPLLEQMRQKYAFGKPTVVADAGLLSRQNIALLTEKGYHYILGARIRNESDAVKEQILLRRANMRDGSSAVITKEGGIRLVVTYSDKRARKDRHMREKGLRKLRARIHSGTLTKESINNRGYNKFLILEGKATMRIDERKVQEDERWDGLKGYVTNTTLTPEEVVAQYTNLWCIERAFRISKTDLRIRPMFHRKRSRIEAHLCIAFVAYAIYKELERQLQMGQAGFSAQHALELTQTIYELTGTLPDSRKQETVVLPLNDEQQLLLKIIDQLKPRVSQ